MDDEVFVDKVDACEMISLLNDIYKDMIEQQKAFENCSNDLTQEWQGKGANGAKTHISTILEQFTVINDRLKNLTDLASVSLKDIDQFDNDAAESYDL